MTMANRRIQNRRGSSSDLALLNEVPMAGEIVIETDTGKFKIGDGVTSWNSLEYASGVAALPSDGKVYVIKDGEYVEAQVVDMTSSWQPSIESDEIVLAVDEDMTAYQLTGVNVEVNA